MIEGGSARSRANRIAGAHGDEYLEDMPETVEESMSMLDD